MFPRLAGSVSLVLTLCFIPVGEGQRVGTEQSMGTHIPNTKRGLGLWFGWLHLYWIFFGCWVYLLSISENRSSEDCIVGHVRILGFG